DLYTVGKELKKMGNPVGIPISQNYDSISTAGPVLWSFGGTEVDKDGKTVRINSPATLQTIEWYKKMFRDCMEPEVLSWSDASNNESIQQGKAGWIHNPVSAYIVAKQRKLVTADGINHHRSLGGPHGRHETDTPRHIGIWKFSKNIDASKEWIRYLLGKREQYDEYIMAGDAFNLPAYEKLQDHPVLRSDPKYAAAGRGGPVPHVRLAGAAVGQGAAHHQLLAAAQHDRQGGHRHADQGRDRLGRDRDEKDHGGLTHHGHRHSSDDRPACASALADARARDARPRARPGPAVHHPRPHPHHAAGRLPVLRRRLLLRVQLVHRAAEPLHRPDQLHPSLGRRRLPADVPERLRVHRDLGGLQARARHLAGPAAQPAALVQADDPRRRAAALGPPARAVDAGLVVDVQLALQRRELDGHRDGDHGSAGPELARPAVLRDGRRHHRQHLARPALLRH